MLTLAPPHLVYLTPSCRGNHGGARTGHTTRAPHRQPATGPRDKIAYEGPRSDNPLAFKHYDPSEVIDGRTMKEHLRFSIAYWHAFRATGSDPFGPGTINRPWVKQAIEATQKLGGENYVFWGGREGYETLLNTNLKREQDHLARFLHLAVDHAKKIGFKGQFLIEPKPKEPTKHQYDFDVASGIAFLRTYGARTALQVQHRDQPRHPRRPQLTSRIS